MDFIEVYVQNVNIELFKFFMLFIIALNQRSKPIMFALNELLA